MLTDYKNEGKWLITGRAALQLSHGGAGANTRAAKSFLTIGNPQGLSGATMKRFVKPIV